MMGIKITLWDMVGPSVVNSKEYSDENDFWNEVVLLSLKEDVRKELKDWGARKIDISVTGIKDWDGFIEKYLKEVIFEDEITHSWEIVRTDPRTRQGYSKGHPDYKIETSTEPKYVELKKNNDSLRMSQLEWFTKKKKEDPSPKDKYFVLQVER